MAVQKRLDVGDRATAHFLVDGADDAPLDLLVEFLAQGAERPGGSNDSKRFEVVAQDSLLQLVGGVLDPAVLFLLVEVGLLHRRTEGVPAAGGGPYRGSARRVGPEFPVLVIFPFVVRLG